MEKVYRDSYSEQQKAAPFSAAGAWMRRFDVYAAISGFDLVVAYAADEEPVGQAWGRPEARGATLIHVDPRFTGPARSPTCTCRSGPGLELRN